MPSIFKLFRLANVSQDKPTSQLSFDRLIHRLLLVIAFFLPFIYYYYRHHVPSYKANTVIITVVWAMMFIRIIIALSSVKDKRIFLQNNCISLFMIILFFPAIWLVYLQTRSDLFLVIAYTILCVLPWAYTAIYFLKENNLIKLFLMFFFITITAGLMIGTIDPGIKSAWQGVWWAFETITTVGYGDVVPTGLVGQLFSILFMVVGVGLMGRIASFMTLKKLDPQMDLHKVTLETLTAQLNTIQTQVKALSDQQTEILVILKKDKGQKHSTKRG